MGWEATWVNLYNGLAQIPAHGKCVVEVGDADDGGNGDDDDDDSHRYTEHFVPAGATQA